MFRQLDVALQAFKAFIKMTHCPGDRGAIGIFNDSLSWACALSPADRVQELESGKAGLGNCLDDIEASGGTRLYDSMCDAVDLLNEYGDGSRPWYIFALTYNDDDKSIRSAKECGKHIFDNYASRSNKCCIIVISVGKDVNRDELNGIEINECLYHVHVKSSAQLENTMLWKISFGNILGDRNYEIDYVALVNNSASMGILRHPKQQLVPITSFGERVPMTSGSSMQSGTASARSRQKPESSDAESMPPLALPAPSVQPAPLAPSTPPAPPSSRVTIRMREFINRDLHPSDRQIFREFAAKNYPNIPNSWEEEDIEFLVLVESAARSIVGLLVMLPYYDGRVHIRLMVVNEEYRKHGLGTKMLTYVAGKYRNRTVTLNVAFDRLDLLNFYYDKGYVKFEEFSTKHKVICFSLVHLKLLATMQFPG